MIRIFSTFWMFAIVLYHASSAVEVGWYSELMSDCRMGGVGFFFAVSGYFLMKRYGRTTLIVWWKDEVRKRVFSVLVPYLIWCGIALVIHCMVHGFGAACNPKALTDAFGLTSLVPLANTPLWYLKFLFLFVFISPVIWLFVRSCWIGGGLLALGAVAVPLLRLPCSFSFFYSIILFSAGMYFALWGKKCAFARNGVVVGWAVCLAVLLLLVFLHQSSSVMVRMYRAYLAVGVSFGVAELFGQITRTKTIVLPTFFVFCSHSILIRLMPVAHTPHAALILATSVFVVLIGVAILFKRLVPTVYAFLTAGR